MPMTREEALVRARRAVEVEGWPWEEPAEAHYREACSGQAGTWEIFTNVHEKGARARVKLNAETGEVLEKGHISR
ncbi:MAG: hypothetical protein HY235_23645 [Acidobacteria bacterium]|nr:hypothetical protein [Acidobacteriota bacterium]